MNQNSRLVESLLRLPIFESEWVLYLLIFLSVASIAVMIERFAFYLKRRVDIDDLRVQLSSRLAKGDYAGAAALMQKQDALETNVVLVGLQAAEKGPESVEDLLAGALGREKARYERRLSFL